ncbi:MAG: 30S ribosomal protein S6 [Chrysiogenales bacterium]|nr:MAG: 30S ribosomal protein S6 [Chrysiogenales bacterium]
MNTYELTVIVRSRDSEPLLEKVREILSKHGVVQLGDTSPGVKKLAYQIDGQKEGYYFSINAEIPADSVKKIIADFRLNNGILRWLFVKIEKPAVA